MGTEQAVPEMNSRWLTFRWIAKSPSGKTDAWRVISKSSDKILGTIYWYAPWRQYSFAPEPGTVFNRECLRDLAEFLETVMAKRAGKD